MYARGSLGGMAQCAEDGDEVDITLLASRYPVRPRGASGHPADPVAQFGRPLRLSVLPGPLLTRAWDHGLVRAPHRVRRGALHLVGLPAARPTRAARSVVTVHDVAWRRQPAAATGRGARWHEAALRRACDSGAALVVTSKLVAADLVSDGVDADRLIIVHGGSDHLVAEDAVQTDALLRRLGVPGEFLLTVSTLEPRKNVDRLLQAYARARPALPEPWPLVIVGPTGWGRS